VREAGPVAVDTYRRYLERLIKRALINVDGGFAV
jgi:RecB family endonuclease NucS